MSGQGVFGVFPSRNGCSVPFAERTKLSKVLLIPARGTALNAHQGLAKAAGLGL